MTTPAITLTPHQQAALDQCLRQLETQGEALLCGAAGTGKTHLIGALGQQKAILCMAPTNAAARVLRRKLPQEIPVSTIHAAAMQLNGQTHQPLIRFLDELSEHLIVDKSPDDMLADCIQIQSQYNNLEPEHISQCVPPELLPRLAQLWDSGTCRCGELLAGCDPWLTEASRRAHKHNQLQFSAGDKSDRKAEILVVDEASMCTTEHRNAIRSVFGDAIAIQSITTLGKTTTTAMPVLWVGDPAQLPPVIDEEGKKQGIRPVLDFLEPCATLSEQHRQADGSILLALLERMRAAQGPFRSKTGTWPGCQVQPRPASGITKGLVKQFAEHIGEDGVAICWRNTTRHNLNRQLRALRGFGPAEWLPQTGDRLVVSLTPREPDPVGPDWAKGTLIEVLDVFGPKQQGNSQFQQLALRVAEPGHPKSFVISTGCLAFLETYKMPRLNWALYGDWLLDYGYAITAHKAQGNEWPRIAVYEERAHEQETNSKGQLRSRFVGWPAHRQWLYTALSRAQESVLLIAQGD